MLTACLYNCRDVTDLCGENDQNPFSTCTSTLQKWHKPTSKGISSQPVMEVLVTKSHQDEKKTAEVQFKLYEPRKEQTSNIAQFLKTINDIDPTFGLVHVM